MIKYSNILIEVATREARLMRSKVTKEEALATVKDYYNLTESETSEIDDILDADEDSDSNIDSTDSDTDEGNTTPVPSDFIIYFDSEDDLDDAVGRLMFNRVIWKEQGEFEGRYRIVFKDDKSLNKALKILRRSLFVQDDFTPVAAIYFDNLEEFQKTTSFMRKNDMYVEDSNFDGSLTDTESMEQVFLAVPAKKSDVITTNIAVRKTW